MRRCLRRSSQDIARGLMIGMARKSFQGIDAILGMSEVEPTSPSEELSDRSTAASEEKQLSSGSNDSSKGPSLIKPDRKEGAGRGRPVSGVRATTVFRPESLERVRAVAYWERRAIKDVVDDALTQFFESKGEEYIEIAVDAWRAS